MKMTSFQNELSRWSMFSLNIYARQKDSFSVRVNFAFICIKTDFSHTVFLYKYEFSMVMNLRVITYFINHLPKFYLISTTLGNLNTIISKTFCLKESNKSHAQNTDFRDFMQVVYYKIFVRRVSKLVYWNCPPSLNSVKILSGDKKKLHRPQTYFHQKRISSMKNVS